MVLVEARQRHAHLLLDVLRACCSSSLTCELCSLLLLRDLCSFSSCALGLDQLVVVVLADGDEFLGHLLLVIEADEKFLQRRVGLGEFLLRLRLRCGCRGALTTLA